jgi:hypothetical protein
MDQMNIDLTYSVCFNLAAQYEANEMYSEVSMCICVCVRARARLCNSGTP